MNEELKAIMSGVPFTFAKTMPDNPHEYTLLQNWQDKDQFRRAVQLILTDGYTEHFQGYAYQMLEDGEFKYWTMVGYDESQFRKGVPYYEPFIINRKKLVD